MTKKHQIRVVVADAHPLFTLGVRALLNRDATVALVGEAADGERTLQVLRETRPDVLLLGLSLKGIGGLEVLTRMASMNLPTRAVIVATAIQTAERRVALLRGARGVLLKHMASELLVKCVHQVMKDQYWISRDDVGELVDVLRKSEKADEPASGLSERELEIVRAVLKGAGNKDIASQLGLGEQTVKNHLRRIFAKLGVANRVQLAVHALERQLAVEDTERTTENETTARRRRSS